MWMDPGGPCERPLRCTVPGPLHKCNGLHTDQVEGEREKENTI